MVLILFSESLLYSDFQILLYKHFDCNLYYLQTLTQSFDYCQPLEQQNGVVPDRDAEYRLFDRVVNVRENFSVPVGLRGTVIGIKGGNIFFILVVL